MSDTSRREFLQRAAGLAGGAMVGIPAFEAMTAGARAGASPFHRLARRLKGSLVLPDEAGYKAAKSLWNPVYDRIRPQAIAFCETPGDVAQVVRFACRHQLPIAARSGRHSFAGYCATTGIVADVSRIRRIAVDSSGRTARVGAGADNLDLFYELAVKNGVALPSGTCPTVGAAGITLGGGIGHLTRKHGLTSDNLQAVEMILADGRLVHCDERRNADLFWACGGGGGGNFGIATELHFRVRPAPDMVFIAISWPWQQAAEALDAWQRSMPQAPDDMSFAEFRLVNTGGGNFSLGVSGRFLGSEDEARAVLAPLLAVGGATRTEITARSYVEANVPGGCTLNGTKRPMCTVVRYPNYQRSDFVAQPWSAKAIQTVIEFVERWPGGPNALEGGVQLEAMGGAVNRVPRRATAFVHRDQLFHCVYLNFWGSGSGRTVAEENRQWARDFYKAMRPYVSGYAYQNYIDPELRGWEHAYYGVNYPRLRRTKTRLDPGNLFRFRQSIRPL